MQGWVRQEARALTPPQAPNQLSIFIGIDVAKTQLEVAVRPTGEHRTVPQTEAGMADLVARVQALAPALIVLEATGGLERLASAALAATGLAVAVVNPRQVRAFAKATGRLAKTDRLDAQLVAHFAEAVPPEPRPLLEELAQEWRRNHPHTVRETLLMIADQPPSSQTESPAGEAPDPVVAR